MLKILAIFVTILATAQLFDSSSKDVRNWMEDEIREALEQSKELTPDPWIIEDFEISQDFGVFGFTVGIDGTSVNGSAGFEIEKVTFDLDTWDTDIALNYPELVSAGNKYFSLTFSGGAFEFDYNVTENVQINDFFYEYQYRMVNDTDGKVLIKDSRITITVGSIDFKMHGTINNNFEFGDKISELITNYGAKFINDHQEIISDVLSAFTQFIIDITQNSTNR